MTPDRPPTFDELPPMLTLAETAAICRISASNAYESARSGWLRGVAVKVGTQWRVPRDKLRRFLEGEAP